MSITEMTYVSYFFMVTAVVFGIITVVMFFVLDIRRCWRIVWGRHTMAPTAAASNTAPKGSVETTEQLERLARQETEVLLPPEKTAPPETMILVQDIVMMDADSGDCLKKQEYLL